MTFGTNSAEHHRAVEPPADCPGSWAQSNEGVQRILLIEKRYLKENNNKISIFLIVKITTNNS